MPPASKLKLRHNGMPGMRPFPRERQTPIEEMKPDELRTLYRQNEEALRSLHASSSAHVAGIENRQAQIRQKLADIEGMDSIQRGLRRATISEDTRMVVDKPERYTSRTVQAKQQAIASWEKSRKTSAHQKTGIMSFEEAIALEQEKGKFDKERKERKEAKREKHAMPSRTTPSGKRLSLAEYEAKVWAFMNYKPSESDMEEDDDDYDDDEDEDDDDPASWFHDDQDDGIKGQNIVYPDAEDLSDIIRVDGSRFSYNT